MTKQQNDKLRQTKPGPFLVAGILAFIGALAVAFLVFQTPGPKAVHSDGSSAALSTQTTTPLAQTTQEASKIQTDTGKNLQKEISSEAPHSALPLNAPSKSRLASEVQNDVHSTPPSLLEFADHMALLMEPALQNENDARRAFPKLVECATSSSPEMSRSIVSLCLANAQRLSQKHPKVFATEFSNLLSVVPADLLSLSGVRGKNTSSRALSPKTQN